MIRWSLEGVSIQMIDERELLIFDQFNQQTLREYF